MFDRFLAYVIQFLLSTDRNTLNHDFYNKFAIYIVLNRDNDRLYGFLNGSNMKY